VSFMSNVFAYAENALPPSERRVHARQQIKTLAYVELDEGNGGIILNVSEGGLAVQAVTSLMDDHLPRVRFQLSQSPDWVETSARVTWAGESRKLVGLEFIDLSELARGQINEWLSRETSPDLDPAEGKADSELEKKEDEQIAIAVPAHEKMDSIAAEVEPPLVSETQSQPAMPVEEAPLTAATPIAVPDVPAAMASSPSVEIPVATKARDFKFTATARRPAVAPVVARKLSPLAFAALLVFLAIGSLAAGWAAGEGALNKALEKIYSIRFIIHTANREVRPSSANRVARVSEIEVVSLNSQRWTIPFNGPSSPVATAEENARVTTPANVPQETPKAPLTFHTWVLSPPVQSRSATNGSGTLNQAPPISADAPPNPQNDPASSGAIGSSGLVPQKPLAVPQVQQSMGIVKQGELIHRIDPIYPAVAREQRIEGTVKLNVTVGADGSVRSVTLVSGSQLLLQAAIDAVRQWRYAPTLLDGKPIESQKQVSLVFHF
jgi:TonB family protein